MNRNKMFRFLGIALCFIFLVLIRFFEKSLFYDPLIQFYEYGYLHNQIPQFHWDKLLFFLSFRFFLNTLLSLAVIYLVFQKKGILKFAALLYFILFIFAFSAFIILLLSIENGHFLALFYVRRFLIQPLFLLLLLPAFYYYRLKKTNFANT